MISNKFKENGQALVVIALSAIVLFGFVALAIDGTAKFSDRRRSQNAADTAALAAALAKVDALTKKVSDNSPSTGAPTTCPPPSGVLPSPVCQALQLAGLNRAVSNGYSNDLTTSTVEIYSPPISGYYSTVLNKDEYVQVIITSHIKTYFARVFGINQTNNIVQAVAYAKKGGVLADGAMIISYDPNPNCSSGGGSGGGSVDVSGNATINLNGGGIFVNSQNTCGYSQPSCSVTLNIIGSGSINSAATIDNLDLGSCGTATEKINQPPVIIPDDISYPDLPPECGVTATAYNNPVGSDTWHITPGYYTDFPQYNLNGDKMFGNKKNIIMDPGVYCVAGDIHWSGTTFNSLDGSSGVTIYLKSPYHFSLSINSPVTLYASKSGDYQGYLLIQEGTQTSIETCVINGGAYLDIEGLIFAPYCNITINGGSEPTAQINAQLIGWDIKLNGNNTINFNYNPSNKVIVKRKIGLMK